MNPDTFETRMRDRRGGTATALRDDLAAEARALLDDPNATPEQIEECDRQITAIASHVQLDEHIQRLDAMPAAERARYVQSGDGAVVNSNFQVMRQAEDPWAGDLARSAMHQSPMQIRDRAMTALERSGLHADAATLAEPLVRDANDPYSIGSRWAIATSNPAYNSAFNKFVKNPVLGHAQFDENERAAYVEAEHIRTAMNEGTTTQGQFLVPAHLDPAINILNAGTVKPFRDIPRVVQTTSFQWQPISSAGVTAEWRTESQEASDASPTIARPTIQVHGADAYLQASFELVADSDIASEVSRLIVDAKDRLESAAFVNGTGGGQPWGLITRLTSVAGAYEFGTSGSTVEAEIKASDIYALDNALDARYQPNASFLGHRAIFNQIRQLATGSGSQHAFWQDFGGGGIPPTLIGHPVYESSVMDSTVVTGSEDNVLVLGDFRNYVVVDRIGFQLSVNPMVVGGNRRPTGEIGFFGVWRVGADLLDATTAAGFKFLHK